MTENFPTFHTLDVEYNGFGPFTAVSSERGGIHVAIGTHTMSKVVGMYINIRVDKNTTKHYALNNLQPGDRLKFTYDGANVDSGTSIDKIEEHDRSDAEHLLGDGLRYGYDLINR